MTSAPEGTAPSITQKSVRLYVVPAIPSFQKIVVKSCGVAVFAGFLMVP